MMTLLAARLHLQALRLEIVALRSAIKITYWRSRRQWNCLATLFGILLIVSGVLFFVVPRYRPATGITPNEHAEAFARQAPAAFSETKPISGSKYLVRPIVWHAWGQLLVNMVDSSGNPVPDYHVASKITPNASKISSAGAQGPKANNHDQIQIQWALGDSEGGIDAYKIYAVGFHVSDASLAHVAQGPTGKYWFDFATSSGDQGKFRGSVRSADELSTTISGVVLDNSNVPLPGVTLRRVSTNALHSNIAAIGSLPKVDNYMMAFLQNVGSWKSDVSLENRLLASTERASPVIYIQAAPFVPSNSTSPVLWITAITSLIGMVSTVLFSYLSYRRLELEFRLKQREAEVKMREAELKILEANLHIAQLQRDVALADSRLEIIQP